jgi:hypothetical protein
MHKWHDPDIAAALLELLSLLLQSILMLTMVLLLLLSLRLPFHQSWKGLQKTCSHKNGYVLSAMLERLLFVLLSLSLLLMLVVKTSACQLSKGTQYAMDLIKSIVPIVTNPKDCQPV